MSNKLSKSHSLGKGIALKEGMTYEHEGCG